jgi:choline dehydrogenase-like flavoprotein
VIICAGAMSSPAILERSGIGDPQRLAALGIETVHANPAVGEHLIEHRALLMQWSLKNAADSFNRCFHGWRLGRAVANYLLMRRGPIGSAAFDLGAWIRSRPGLSRPNTQFLLAAHSLDFAKMGLTTESFPGMAICTYQLRPTSTGSVHIRSTDPEAAPCVIANHGSTAEDRRAMVDGVRACRHLVSQSPLKELIAEETRPGPQYESDEEILKAYDIFGTCGYHAVGTCRMGSDSASVIDPELKVRGVEALRVMDTSIIPIIPSGNTQAPIMAMAWRAADIIRRS